MSSYRTVFLVVIENFLQCFDMNSILVTSGIDSAYMLGYFGLRLTNERELYLVIIRLKMASKMKIRFWDIYLSIHLFIQKIYEYPSEINRHECPHGIHGFLLAIYILLTYYNDGTSTCIGFREYRFFSGMGNSYSLQD